MKNVKLFLFMTVALMVLSGCMDKQNKNSADDISDEVTTSESMEGSTEKTKADSPEGSATLDTGEKASEKDEDDKVQDILSPYSDEQIEYARVWSQLGPNQEIEELYIRHIPFGEPINPNIDGSATFPEGVIQLSGSRLIDGSITYKGNGDGTINVYDTHMRWSAPPPDVELEILQNETENILHNTESIYIEPRNDERIVELIELQTFHNQ